MFFGLTDGGSCRGLCMLCVNITTNECIFHLNSPTLCYSRHCCRADSDRQGDQSRYVYILTDFKKILGKCFDWISRGIITNTPAFLVLRGSVYPNRFPARVNQGKPCFNYPDVSLSFILCLCLDVGLHTCTLTHNYTTHKNTHTHTHTLAHKRACQHTHLHNVEQNTSRIHIYTCTHAALFSPGQTL